MARTKIGTMTLAEPRDLRQSYEVAAWYKTVHCEPQTVDVLAEVKDGQVVDTGIGWSLTGTVTEAHFPSLAGGLAMTSGERPEEIGKEETVHVNPYAHALARQLLEELEDAESGLALDVEPLYVPFRGSDGRGHYTTGLFTEPTDEQRQQSRGVQAALQGQPIPHDSPTATFGWAMAKQVEAEALLSEAKRTRDIADYALRTYAPELAKPEISSIEPEL